MTVRIMAEKVRPGHIIPNLNDGCVTDVFSAKGDPYWITITYTDAFYRVGFLTVQPGTPIDVSGEDY